MPPPFFRQALLAKTSGMPGLGFKAVAWPQHSKAPGAQESGKFQLSESSPQTDERCVAELSCNALPRPATESGSRPRYLAPKVHQDNSPGQRPGDRWVDTRQPEGLREISFPF